MHLLQSTFRHLFRLVAGASWIVHCAGAGSLLLLVVLVSFDALNRNLFLSPVSGVPEIITLSIVVIVFLQAPQALISGRLTRSDTFMSMLAKSRPGLVCYIKSLFDLAGALVFAVVAYGTWPMLSQAWRFDEFVGSVGDFTAPVWPVRLAVLTGSILLMLIFCCRFFLRLSSDCLDPLQEQICKGDNE